MPQTIARIKKIGKHFEILVDLDQALKFKKGEITYVEAEGDRVFKDVKRGEVASSSDLKEAFKTEDVNEIAKKIVKEGEVQVTQDYRDEEREKKIKQVVDFLHGRFIRQDLVYRFNFTLNIRFNDVLVTL